jgi:hypothetical protein
LNELFHERIREKNVINRLKFNKNPKAVDNKNALKPKPENELTDIKVRREENKNNPAIASGS